MKHTPRATGALMLLAASLLFAYLLYDASELVTLVNLRPDREALVAIVTMAVAASVAILGVWLIRRPSAEG